MENKKNPEADLDKKRPAFIFGGLLVALAIVLAAFEFRTFKVTKKQNMEVQLNTMEQEFVPPSKPKKPPPPKKPTTQVEVVEEEEDIEDELEMPDMEIDEGSEIEFEEPQQEENVEEDKVFMVVEDNPTFPGGQAAMMKWIQEHLKYPEMAKEMDISGTVYVSFTVEKNGDITNVQVLRGIGGGCDKEAKRIIKQMPKWKPGKQRGRAVRVNMKLPIRFTLQ